MIIAIDCGSTNHKVALFDEELRRVASSSKPVVYGVRDAERVEFDPEQIWHATVGMIRAVCAKARVTPSQIKTITLTSQANTFTLVNPAGKPVIPFISWLDKRAAEESAYLAQKIGKEFHRHCSVPTPLPQLQISKLIWLSRHLPQSARVGARVMSLPTFLAWRLAGLYCTDANLAAMSGMYSLAEKGWWKESLSACSLTAENCGEVVAPGSAVVAERRCSELDFPSDLKIVFAGNDQTAGALANNVCDGGLVLTLGTALVAYRFAGTQVGPFGTAGWWGQFPGGGFYELMARDEGCNALDWAVERIMPGMEAEFFRLAMTASCGSGIFFPQLMHRPGAWVGSNDLAARARSVLEGISFSLREMVEAMIGNHDAKKVINIIGGGSANAFWLSMVANVLNRPVRRGDGDNLLGAAMMACPDVLPPEASHSEVFSPEPAQVEKYGFVFHKWQQRGSGITTTTSLPYTDTKEIGSADFYFAINATFRFIETRLGREGLRRYWLDLGEQYFSNVSAAWKGGGLQSVADYWRAFFKAEPDGDVEVISKKQSVVLDVQACPAIKHLRAHGREIVPCFCQHCYFVTEAMAAPAGFTVRIDGGNGECRQTILPRDLMPDPQDFAKIKEVT